MVPLILTGAPLSIRDVVDVARSHRSVEIDAAAAESMAAARTLVEEIAESDAAVYGINTGFGALSKERVAPEATAALQLNIVRSHAAGTGSPLPDDVVRAMMVILAASLARGRSGVAQGTVQMLLDLLNAGIMPIVPSRGSVGASGDLAPLAHVALVLIGEGRVCVNGATIDTASALSQASLKPIVLGAKEGLALLNGTHLMAACATLAIHDIEILIDTSCLATAMSLDAAKGTHAPLDPRLHNLRGHRSQSDAAARIREVLRGSTIATSHAQDDPRVQDPYSFRCAPQVLGAVIQTVADAKAVIETELGAVTDNPLVLAEDRDVLSGGNFHGMPLAMELDAMAVALSHLAGISERRTFWLQSAHDPYCGLPAHLSPDPGLHSGLMIHQYTAAALCAELRHLAAPASVHNIPTAAGIEDYNSMGATAGLHLLLGVDLARRVIAIELLTACEGIEHHRPLRSGDGVEQEIERIRALVPPWRTDRSPEPDIAAVAAMIQGT